jgi:hypothetical protein
MTDSRLAILHQLVIHVVILRVSTPCKWVLTLRRNMLVQSSEYQIKIWIFTAYKTSNSLKKYFGICVENQKSLVRHSCHLQVPGSYLSPEILYVIQDPCTSPLFLRPNSETVSQIRPPPLPYTFFPISHSKSSYRCSLSHWHGRLIYHTATRLLPRRGRSWQGFKRGISATLALHQLARSRYICQKLCVNCKGSERSIPGFVQREMRCWGWSRRTACRCYATATCR